MCIVLCDMSVLLLSCLRTVLVFGETSAAAGPRRPRVPGHPRMPIELMSLLLELPCCPSKEQLSTILSMMTSPPSSYEAKIYLSSSLHWISCGCLAHRGRDEESAIGERSVGEVFKGRSYPLCQGVSCPFFTVVSLEHKLCP